MTTILHTVPAWVLFVAVGWIGGWLLFFFLVWRLKRRFPHP